MIDDIEKVLLTEEDIQKKVKEIKKGMGEKGDKKPKKKVNINLSLKGALDSIEKGLLRSAVGLAFIIIIYTVLSIALSNSINAKEREAKQRLQETNSEIQKN